MILPKFSFGTELCLGEGAAPEPTTADLTHSVDFDGVNDNASKSYDADFDLVGLNQFTFVAYFKTSSATLGAFFGSYETSSGDEQYIFCCRGDATGRVAVYLHDGTNFRLAESTTDSLDDGAWHLAVVGVNGNNISFFIDGGTAEVHTSSNFTGTINAPSSGTQQLTIGAGLSSLGNIFTGRLCYLSLFKGYAFNQSDADELWNGGDVIDPTTHSAAANLGFYYPLGTGDTYPTLIDQSGKSGNATMNNMASGDIVADAP